jgi:hypothetical protein
MFDAAACPCNCCFLQAPPDSPSSASWQHYLQSPGWQHELDTSRAVAPGFQIKATDAVAAALWAVVRHWDSPVDALVAAVHYGGDTDTIACMAGERGPASCDSRSSSSTFLQARKKRPVVTLHLQDNSWTLALPSCASLLCLYL